MRIKISRLSTRLIVALLTFTVGVAVTLLWLTPHFYSRSTPEAFSVSQRLNSEKVSLPEGWKKLEIKDRITLSVPDDMKPSELIGDSLSYREAYNNRDLNVTIVYGEAVSCRTPAFLLKRTTYQESIIDIGGRKARLGIDRFYEPEFIIARLCFLDADASDMQLNLAAICKDNRALETANQIFTSIRFKDNK